MNNCHCMSVSQATTAWDKHHIWKSTNFNPNSPCRKSCKSLSLSQGSQLESWMYRENHVMPCHWDIQLVDWLVVMSLAAKVSCVIVHYCLQSGSCLYKSSNIHLGRYFFHCLATILNERLFASGSTRKKGLYNKMRPSSSNLSLIFFGLKEPKISWLPHYWLWTKNFGPTIDSFGSSPTFFCQVSWVQWNETGDLLP